MSRAPLAALLAGATTRTLRGALGNLDASRWERVNHRGEAISLLEGPAVLGGLAAGALAVGDVRAVAGVVVAGAGAGAFGLHDDLHEDTKVKGLRGHLGALREGTVTTGALKVAGIGASAFVAAVLLTRGRGPARAADVVVNTGLIAGTANLLNLLDLRPGRALKAGSAVAAALVLGGPGVARGAGCAVLGAAAAAAPADLAERDMLGDSGANALGAVLGAGLSTAPRPVRLLALTGVVGLTLASERVSFSRVIEQTPALRRIDSWGRRA
ncbi:hypothetical protein GCM10011331_19370 [Flavimobilis marinus]|uniref:UDP-N-acetylmuramyl pentapeptide phosphotransferase/UDP-N-acetylglucosamine-1-phosphate transferase n=1 Tax=Flavimobilis marinus TaxID=285351 RepID=A0A1I2F0K4_9MICO|nr:hypothetical protein [Flavimobilis marinus]GHG53660.1 hypothetical protein GCM10011331_19370 [Flavimobilis marinus]SFE98040.1 hypothetical protein SAMN04488035_1017 [Flavimobilis marinus]